MLARIAVLALWGFGIGSLVVDYPGIWANLGLWTLVFLLITHAGETLYFLKHMKERAEPLMPNVISSFVYGIVHNWRYLKK